MFQVAVKWSFILILGLIIAINVRVVLPTIWEYDRQFLFSQIKYTVIKVFISLSGVIVLEMLLLYLSMSLIYMTTDWLAMLYFPFLIYAVHRIYDVCLLNLSTLISTEYAYKILLYYWRRYFELDDQFFIQIQKKLGCCGLEGPRTYLMYLRRVHPSCYTNRNGEVALITTGCEDVAFDHFYAVQILGQGLSWLALFLQILMIEFYLAFIIQKYVYMIYPNLRRLRIYIY